MSSLIPGSTGGTAANADVGRPPKTSHADSAGRVVDALEADPREGLSTDEAQRRLAAFGTNELAEPPSTSFLALYIAQFRSLLILVLVAAALIAAAIGEFREAIVIAVVLLINALLGAVQEGRAERSVAALRTMLSPQARVLRDGTVHELPAAEVVPGDIVLVEAGDRIAADGRILDAVRMATDESSLTGETSAVTKDADAEVAADAAIADQRTMAWTNTTIVRGRGTVVVTATGMNTRVGKVADLLAQTEQRQTPLQRQLDTLGKRLASIAGVSVGVVLLVSLLRGDTIAQAAMDSIALALAAIPEGLPAVVTVTLAVGTAAMARRQAIVKRLAAVETLGSTEVICTDKTGTLTRNEMTACALWRGGVSHEITGDGYATAGTISPAEDLSALATAMVRCNDAHLQAGELVGDPTEGALLVLAVKAGADVSELRSRPRVDEAPFDPATKYMTTVDDDRNGRTAVSVKGAPDVVLEMCATLAGSDGHIELTDDWKQQAQAAITRMAEQGMRTLAVATRTLDAAPDQVGDAETLTADLHLQAIVGIVDPPRDGVAEAIATAHGAGIDVKMITGDHPATAAAIGKQVGIRGRVVTGAELDAFDDDELADCIDDIGVCARVAPEHKVRIVETLQRIGHTAAMTGDGVNDAPALKRADVGVAMGIAGTEVSKEAADLVLADDNFATIITAVEHGRGIYENIVSFVRFQVATNIGAILTILAARLIGLPAPMTPIQLLWVNLIMDGPPAMALGVDPARPDTMLRQPRDPKAQILDRPRLLRLLLSGLVMGTGTISVFAWGLSVSSDDGEFATTLAFTTFVLFQFMNALNARTQNTTVFSAYTLKNGKLWLALALVLGLQIAAVHITGFGQLIDVVPIGIEHWALALAVASSLLVVEEVRKFIARRL